MATLVNSTATQAFFQRDPGGVFLGLELAEIGLADLGTPGAVGIARDASMWGGAASCGDVQGVHLVRDDPQVRPSIIKPVAVDVIDRPWIAGSQAHDLPVHRGRSLAALDWIPPR